MGRGSVGMKVVAKLHSHSHDLLRVLTRHPVSIPIGCRNGNFLLEFLTLHRLLTAVYCVVPLSFLVQFH